MKYCIEVGSFTTRMVTRKIIVNANNEEDACEKAIEKFEAKEKELACSVDVGTPQINFVDIIK